MSPPFCWGESLAEPAREFCPRPTTRVAGLLHCRPMKAWFLDPASMKLELRDAPRPEPRAGQLLVRVRAAGLNRGEFLRHGLTRPGAAKLAGTEGAGEVEGTGQRVMGRLPGAFAEYAVMDEADAIPVPEGMGWE